MNATAENNTNYYSPSFESNVKLDPPMTESKLFSLIVAHFMGHSTDSGTYRTICDIGDYRVIVQDSSSIYHRVRDLEVLCAQYYGTFNGKKVFHMIPYAKVREEIDMIAGIYQLIKSLQSKIQRFVNMMYLNTRDEQSKEIFLALTSISRAIQHVTDTGDISYVLTDMINDRKVTTSFELVDPDMEQFTEEECAVKVDLQFDENHIEKCQICLAPDQFADPLIYRYRIRRNLNWIYEKYKEDTSHGISKVD